MRILMVHNYYQRWGGEDESTEQELRLLSRHGHEVRLYSRHNNEIKAFSLLRKGLLFFEPTWSWKSYNEIKRILLEFQPDIVHFQNFFPLISPAAYYACAEIGVPTIQTLRNYRLLCPIGWLFRGGSICEECSKHSLWRGIRYGCYHNSRLQTASIVLMLKMHRLLGTWQKKVDIFIALTEFARRKFVEGGLPASRIVVRPNFLGDDPGFAETIREYVLFVGRLSAEKGLTVLLEAWRDLPDVPLKIVGDGPIRPWVEGYIRRNRLRKVELVGFVPLAEVLQYLRGAFLLVMPSMWYETFGRTIIEAYATGTPVIASRLGAMAELVEEDETGLLFNPGDPGDLVAKVRYAMEHSQEVARWGRNARLVFERRYSADAAYESLMTIYDMARGK